MAKLTEEQKKSVAQWAADGASLNEIQDRLKNECSISLTYLDARLLMMELDVKIQEKKKAEPEAEASAPAPPAADEMEDAGGDWQDDAAEAEVLPPEDTASGGGNVSVQVDQIAVPGAMV